MNETTIGRDNVGQDAVGQDKIGRDSVAAGRDSVAAGRDINNYAAALDQVLVVLNERHDDLAQKLVELEGRMAALEEQERQRIEDRRALMRVVGSMGVESATVKDVHAMLKQQIEADSADRESRRRFLDRALFAILVISAVQAAVTIFQLFNKQRSPSCLLH